MIGAGITIFFYCKCKIAPTHSKILSIFLHIKNSKEITAMLPGSPQQSIGYPKIKTTPKTVRETLEMLTIDFFEFDKHKTAELVRMEAK